MNGEKQDSHNTYTEQPTNRKKAAGSLSLMNNPEATFHQTISTQLHILYMYVAC